MIPWIVVSPLEWLDKPFGHLWALVQMTCTRRCQSQHPGPEKSQQPQQRENSTERKLVVGSVLKVSKVGWADATYRTSELDMDKH